MSRFRLPTAQRSEACLPTSQARATSRWHVRFRRFIASLEGCGRDYEDGARAERVEGVPVVVLETTFTKYTLIFMNNFAMNGSLFYE